MRSHPFSQDEADNAEKEKVAKFTTGADLVAARGTTSGSAASALRNPVPVNVMGEKYVYSPLEFVVEGPAPPTEAEVARKKFGAHIRAADAKEQAAGYTENVAALRALQEAMCGLYFSAAASLATSDDSPMAS